MDKVSKLSDVTDSKDPEKVLSEVEKIFLCSYNKNEFDIIESCFKKINELFDGRFPGYRACNTNYHNFTHTMDAFLASARLLDGWNIINADKIINEKTAVNLLLAALFHDVGYIQEESDKEGTGAKYTHIHVMRSIHFLLKEYQAFDISKDQLESISSIIKCTGLTLKMEAIIFTEESEKTAGIILGTSDIMGQMADREYLEKLLFLYYEFREAGIPGYETEFDIIKNTLTFYENIRKRLDEAYESVYRYASDHFKVKYNLDENLYMTAIERNIDYIKKILEDESTNFRQKLKRGLHSKDILSA
jgi:hypothetical protein